MAERIPKKIDHVKYTDQGMLLEGSILDEEIATNFLRFTDSIIKSIDDIHYHLQFDVDILGNRLVTGKISTRVILQCQRCMNDAEFDLKSEFNIGFVSNEHDEKKVEKLNIDTYWLVPREYLDPRVLIEDELLLALPQIAMHPISAIGKECRAEVVFLEDEAEEVDKDKENPFNILAQLKNK